MTAADKSLESRLLRFAAALPDTELIDSVQMTSEQNRSKKADVFFRNRSIIAEVKSLMTDVSPKIDKVLDPLRETDEYPAYYGTWPIDRVLAQLPNGELLKKQLYEVVSAGVADLVSDANRQIRATKVAFGLPESSGLLIILNDAIAVLDPRMIAHRAGHTLAKRTSEGEVRYPEIGAVWIISEAHRVQINADLQGIPGVIMESPASSAGDLMLFLDEIQPRWAEFEGLPLVVLPESDFGSMKFDATSTSRDDQSLSDVWRAGYSANAYLASLSRDDLVFYAARLTLETALVQQSPTATRNSLLRATRRFAELNEELNRRHIDIRIVRRMADQEGMRFVETAEMRERTGVLADACDTIIE